MKYKTQALIALAAGTLLTLSVVPVLGARATDEDESVLPKFKLSPAGFYNVVGGLESKDKMLQDHINTVSSGLRTLTADVRSIQGFLNDPDTARGFCEHMQTASKKQEVRIAELERKVAGMQKQITILHAKKADKWDAQHCKETK